MMATWQVKGLQLFASLSLLIILHEFGHFFFAKLFKTKVEKFYLFFDFLFPFGNVLNFSLFKKKKGETEYGIGWFPLGGYVKIAGMVDESMDKEQLALPPQPWEYRSKKAWQRLLIMLGGIIVNIVVAIVIYSAIFGVWGESYLPVSNAKYGIMTDSVAQSIGLKNGDKIISIDNKVPEQFKDIATEIVFGKAATIQVERNGSPVTINIPREGTIGKILKSRKGTFVAPRFPMVVSEVADGSEAKKMGLRAGDSLIAVNNVPVQFYDEFKDQINSMAKGQAITVTVMGKDQSTRMLTGSVPESKTLGFAPKSIDSFLEFRNVKYGFFGSIAKGFSFTFSRFGFYAAQFKLLFTSKDVKINENLGGIASFGKIFPSEFDWQQFWELTAFISIILAFMNLLPIPGLDGGYVIFLLYEMISGRKVNDKVMEKATTIGLVLLLALMLYANGLDVLRLIRN